MRLYSTHTHARTHTLICKSVVCYQITVPHAITNFQAKGYGIVWVALVFGMDCTGNVYACTYAQQAHILTHTCPHTHTHTTQPYITSYYIISTILWPLTTNVYVNTECQELVGSRLIQVIARAEIFLLSSYASQ